MRARLRIAIVSLVTAIVIALSALHLHEVIGETLEDTGERARLVTEQVRTSLVEAINRDAEASATATLAENKQHWYEAVRTDPAVERLLRKSLVQSSSVVDVAILDENGKILNAGDSSRIGRTEQTGRSWSEWQDENLIWRLLDLFQSPQDLVHDSPLGVDGGEAPVMLVRTSLSPVLLRQTLRPKLRNLAAVSAVSLALSVLLAVVVSKLVGDSLARLGEKIDLVALGDLKSVQRHRFASPELVDLESKLWWLGRQVNGARSDILHLRSNVDQMLRKMEQAVLVFGPDGRLQLAGDAAQRLLARPRDELLGRTLGDLFPTWTGIGAAIDGAAASRRGMRDQAVTLERPNMPSARLILNVEPIRYEDEGTSGVLVTMKDAADGQQVESDLETARRLAAISRVTSGVAHEIKNPLNAMMLHVELAYAKTRTAMDSTQELDVVKRELLRLDRAVKALLDFNRPMDVHLKECDLCKITTELVSVVRPQAQAKGVRVSLSQDSGTADVLADPDLLKQGILNIAVNALEAAPPGGTVEVRLESGNQRYVIVVEDDGPGVPAEIRDKIFNLYFTTKPAASGLGLAMTYRIVQLHGGSITVDGERGKGACFRLALNAIHPRRAMA